MSADSSRRRAIYAGRRPNSSGPADRGTGMAVTKSTSGYRGNPLWPGLIARTAWCNCTSAMHQGVYQVKVRNADCREHRRAA